MASSWYDKAYDLHTPSPLPSADAGHPSLYGRGAALDVPGLAGGASPSGRYRFAARDRGLEAVLMIQVRVHRRDHEIVMRVLQRREAFRKFPFVMVVDV